METPNGLAGYLYPNHRTSRCPRFHECIASRKCQNYDPNLLECTLCESRTSSKENLGGYIPEPVYLAEDVQELVCLMREVTGKHMADPDSEGQIINGKRITEDWNKHVEYTERMKKYSQLTRMQLEETSKNFYVDKSIKDKFDL